MTSGTNRLLSVSLKCGVAGWALICAGTAFADTSANAAAGQSTGSQASTDNSAPAAEIVVTGTLIRGKAPTGGELVTMTSQDIAVLGVADTSQLLGSLPQDAEFNSRPQVGAYGQYQSVNAPLLRYLGGGSSGSNSTLLLVDGVRLPGMGILQTSADIDAIAPGAISRVDAVPDGGSATYGSDAVGGVVNLITRTRYDGLQVGGHFGGAAGGYRQYDASVTSGKTWDSGSVWFSYQYAHHDLLLQNQRPYDSHLATYPSGPGFDQTCANPNFASVLTGSYHGTPYSIAGSPYGIVNGTVPGGVVYHGLLVAGQAPFRCDLSRQTTLLPGEDRHSAMMGFDQSLTDNLTFNVKAYYAHRKAYNDGGPYPYSNIPATITIGSTQVSGVAEGTLNDPIFQHSYTHSSLDAWAVIPKLTWKMGHDWQNVTFFNYGVGKATFEGPQVDTTTLIADAGAGTFNPLTGLFTSDVPGQNALGYMSNFVGYSSGKDTITNGRTVFDGPLLSLPGGEVRAAVGAEFMHEEFSQINATLEDTMIGTLAANTAKRSIQSAFGELSIPVVGEGNRSTGFYSVTLSAAGRYDHYSDFGGTFNPKLGVKWQTTDWFTLRGNWSKSFQAPSLASTAAAIPPSVVGFKTGTFGPTPTTPGASQTEVLLLYPGGGVNLQPQKATTWELGFDIKPPVVPGLSASLTYYNIDFTNRIGSPQFYSSNFYTLYPNSYVLSPTSTAQIQQYLGNAANQNLYANYINNPSSVYALESGLSQNLSATKTSGLDFNINYSRPTSFGTVFGSVGGTYILTFNSQATPTSPFAGVDANNVSRLRLQTTVGFKTDTIVAQANWKMTGQYAVPGNIYQTEVGAFSTVNLSVAYSPKLTGTLSDMTFSLNVDNLLDTSPSYLAGANGTAYGYGANGFTIGRYIQFGVNKKF